MTAPAPAPKAVRVYMRTDGQPLTFSARARSSITASPTWCSSPCDARFLPGQYQLKLNDVPVNGPVQLSNPGTLHGQFESREASREAGWLALNVGGILGGVFLTVGALGGPSWAYLAGGGSLAAGGVLFLITYRADRASVTFTPADPIDVRGLPLAETRSDNGPSAARVSDRAALGSTPRGLGFQIVF